MHPRNGFTEDSKPGVWREISVCGNVFSLRETRSAQQRGKMVRVVTNVLRSLFKMDTTISGTSWAQMEAGICLIQCRCHLCN